MINLAGKPRVEANKAITAELTRCGIEVVPRERQDPDLKEATLGGVLRDQNGEVVFEFRRAWYYWSVKGSFPIQLARELYKDENFRADIRAGGDCACRPPDTWAEWVKDGKKSIPQSEWNRFEEYDKTDLGSIFEGWREKYLVSENPEADGFVGFVDTYHIDSELGLYVFVQTLRKHGLVR